MSQIIPILNQIYQTKGQSVEQWIYLNNYILNQTQEINYFFQFISNKLNTNNNEELLLTLDILDYSMDNGRTELWIKVSSKEFLSTLLHLLKMINDEKVQEKILYMIEKWGKNYDKSSFPNFGKILKHEKDKKNKHNNKKNVIIFIIVNFFIESSKCILFECIYFFYF